jgi:hypothetical protein
MRPPYYLTIPPELVWPPLPLGLARTFNVTPTDIGLLLIPVVVDTTKIVSVYTPGALPAHATLAVILPAALFDGGATDNHN